MPTPSNRTGKKVTSVTPPPAAPPVNWGILSTARICRRWVPALKAAPSARLVAVASRREEAAIKKARDWGCRAVRSYEELINDPEIEAIYIPLPNGLHAEWAAKALRAGKAVACEKSIVATESDLEIIGAAVQETGGWFAETFQYRYHPLFAKAIEVARSGNLGELIGAEATFTFTLDDPENVRWDKSLGGGALFDLGCYTIGVQRHLFGTNPTVRQAKAIWREGPTGFIDETMEGELQFGENADERPIIGRFRFSYADSWSCGWKIEGTAARLVCDHDFAWNVQQHQPAQRLRLEYPGGGDGCYDSKVSSELSRTWEADQEYDSYALMVEEFSSQIRRGNPPRWGFDDSRELIEVLLNVKAAAERG